MAAPARAVLLSSALLLGGCGSESEPEAPLVDADGLDGAPVATVNGTVVPEDMLQAYLRMRGQLDADAPARETALRELADLVLLAQRARDEGLLERTSTQAELAVQRVSWIANQALAVFAEDHPVTDAEIAAEYDRQVERTGRREFRLKHLLVPNRETAEALIARLRAGEPFADLESEQVEARGVSAAGSIDWVNLAQVPAAFGPAVSELGEGEFTTTPVKSEYGWHVILLEDMRPFEPPALETVREGIRGTLARRKIEQYLGSLREEARIDLRPR